MLRRQRTSWKTHRRSFHYRGYQPPQPVAVKDKALRYFILTPWGEQANGIARVMAQEGYQNVVAAKETELSDARSGNILPAATCSCSEPSQPALRRLNRMGSLPPQPERVMTAALIRAG